MANVELLYYTKDYPKLVELVARQCYQSFHKVDEESHRFIRSIMSKGHLSVASVGNIVFGLKAYDEKILLDLMKMKVINNFIRWSFSQEGAYEMIISMNMLTFLDIKNGQEVECNHLFNELLDLTNQVPELHWFYNRDVEIPAVENSYMQMGSPTLYGPLLLSEDYTALKALGFSRETLLIHATITINYMTDRSTGLQLWRHGDMTGGTELSQRYVNRSNAAFREMIGFESGDSAVGERLAEMIGQAGDQYDELLTKLQELGIHQSRAKEVARAILPNAVVTQIIQCRPLRQWQHLFVLRDTNHAQKEAAADVRCMKQLFADRQIAID